MSTTFGKFDQIRKTAEQQKHSAIDDIKNGDMDSAKKSLSTFVSFAKAAEDIFNNSGDSNNESLKSFKNTLQDYIKEISFKINEVSNKVDKISGASLNKDKEDLGIDDSLENSFGIEYVYKEVRNILKETNNDFVFRAHYGDYTDDVENMKDQLSRLIKEEDNEASAIKAAIKNDLWDQIKNIAA